MDNNKFIEYCYKTIKDLFYKEDDVKIYVVWLSKTLQNNKALLSTDKQDSLYYEITFNGDKNELYVDQYRKTKNICLAKEIL